MKKKGGQRLLNQIYLYRKRANHMTRNQFPETSLRYLFYIFSSSNLSTVLKPSVTVNKLTNLRGQNIKKYIITCLQHLLNAEVGILGGAIWSNIPPLALKSGITSIKTATETSPKHKTSAFWTLQSKRIKVISRKLEKGKSKQSLQVIFLAKIDQEWN